MVPNLEEVTFELRPEFEEELASPGDVEGDFQTRGNLKGYVDCEGDQREKADMLLSKLGGP